MPLMRVLEPSAIPTPLRAIPWSLATAFRPVLQADIFRFGRRLPSVMPRQHAFFAERFSFDARPAMSFAATDAPDSA